MIYCKVCVLLTENVRNRTLITVFKVFDLIFYFKEIFECSCYSYDEMHYVFNIHDTTGQRRVGWSDLFLFGNIWNRTYCCRSVIETYQAHEIGSSNLRFEVWSLVARAWQNFYFLLIHTLNFCFFANSNLLLRRTIPEKKIKTKIKPFLGHQNGQNCVFDLFKGKKLVSLQFSLLKKWKQTFPFGAGPLTTMG